MQAFLVSVSGTNETSPLATDGSAIANPIGGTAPYYKSTSNSMEEKIDISQQPKGIYLYQLKTKLGSITAEKIIVE